VRTASTDIHTSLLYEDMTRPAMTADATRVLYVMNPTFCADCPNQQEHLAVHEIGATDPRAAPVTVATSVDPDELM
jgi:hypothetical protein